MVATAAAPVVDVAQLRRCAASAKADLALAQARTVSLSDVEDEEAPQETAYRQAADAFEDLPEDGIVGVWVSEKGASKVFKDHMTHQLSYEESLGNGARLHSFIEWQQGGESEGDDLEVYEGEVTWLDAGERPWYGPSFGEKPEGIGCIQVSYRAEFGLRPAQLQIRIRVEEEDTDWQEPVHFQRRRPEPVPLALDGSKEADGTVTVTCTDSGGYVLGALMALRPEDPVATLVARIYEDIQPPAGLGAHWQLVVGERSPGPEEANSSLADLFGF